MSEDATGSGLGGASSHPATGGAAGARAAGGAGLAVRAPNGGASALGRLVRGLPLPAHDHETPSTGGELDDYLRVAWADGHLTPGGDPHPEYATDLGLAAVQAELEAVYTEPEADARFEQLTRKGAADGYAPLDAGGLVPTAHLPPLAVTDTFVVASEGAMLALAAQVGDICIRSDLGRTFILAALPATLLVNWLEMAAAGQVVSVNGETGVVSLSAADVGAATADHTHPSEQSGQWRFQNNPAIADPGSGYFRSNTGGLSTATTLAISRTTQDGYDIPPPGWGVQAGDTIYVQDRDDSTRWVRYTADEPLAQFATYATGQVTVVGAAGTLAHGTVCQLTFSLAGGGGGGGSGTTLATDTLWDAKGDLAAGTGADAAARLAVGTDGQFLTAASAQATGLLWAANPVTAHAALPNAHHARDHDHTAADGSGALSNEEHDGYSQYANLGADPATPAANRIRLYAKDNGVGVATLYYISESGQIYELPTLTTGGGGSGSGAPANASYVTLAAENKLSGETALGAGVVMIGTFAARPAAATAGRLYLATDTDLVYRDNGATWATFATRHAQTHNLFSADHPDVEATDTPADGDVLTYSTGAGKWLAVAPTGGGGGLPTTGGTMTGALILQGATSGANVLQGKLAADTQPRFRADASGKLEWGPGGSTALDHSLARVSTTALEVTGSWNPATSQARDLGSATNIWRDLHLSRTLKVYGTGVAELGTSQTAAAGTLRLRNAANGLIGWRNAANTADLGLTMNASDHLELTVATGALTTSATAGAASALPGVPAGYLTVTINGTARKLAFWAT